MTTQKNVAKHTYLAGFKHLMLVF